MKKDDEITLDEEGLELCSNQIVIISQTAACVSCHICKHSSVVRNVIKVV